MADQKPADEKIILGMHNGNQDILQVIEFFHEDAKLMVNPVLTAAYKKARKAIERADQECQRLYFLNHPKPNTNTNENNIEIATTGDKKANRANEK